MDGLITPFKISISSIRSSTRRGNATASVINVLRERQAHCLDGGLFAAAMLPGLVTRRSSSTCCPIRVRMTTTCWPSFKQNGCWGCVAKSNFTGLRYRDPIYRSLRELVMSYFDVFFNVEGKKTLRGYTRPVRLARFDTWHWMTEDAGVDKIEKYLKTLKFTMLLTRL